MNALLWWLFGFLMREVLLRLVIGRLVRWLDKRVDVWLDENKSYLIAFTHGRDQHKGRLDQCQVGMCRARNLLRKGE